MPKEEIVYMAAKVTGDGRAWAGTGLAVGWMSPSENNGGEVQIILHADPEHLVHQIKLFADTVGEGAATKVSSPVLSRTELNKLIRSLRNARDKAYGRDE